MQIVFDHVTKKFDEGSIGLEKVSFEIQKGEFVFVIGKSGAGKSTLLRLLTKQMNATSGNIYVDGENITRLKGDKLNTFRREKLGFIFQDFNLLDTLTAYENISLALTIQGINVKEMDKKIKEIAEKLEIQDILKKYPYEISGGQKQRVAVARAIITSPKLILADEPTRKFRQ